MYARPVQVVFFSVPRLLACMLSYLPPAAVACSLHRFSAAAEGIDSTAVSREPSHLAPRCVPADLAAHAPQYVQACATRRNSNLSSTTPTPYAIMLSFVCFIRFERRGPMRKKRKPAGAAPVAAKEGSPRSDDDGDDGSDDQGNDLEYDYNSDSHSEWEGAREWPKVIYFLCVVILWRVFSDPLFLR